MPKICTSCGEKKNLIEFYKHKAYKDGRRSECKACAKIEDKKRYDKAKAEGNVYIKNKQHSTRIYSLKRKFGITIEQYDEILEKQNHSCAICEKHVTEFSKKFSVDHAHTESDHVPAGMIRGLLCYPCNTLLVGRRTDPSIFEKAANYLRQHTNLKVPDAYVKPKRRGRKRKTKVIN